jgi:twitching motility protein PilT
MQIKDLIQLALLKGASDLHLTAGLPPTLRVNGAIEKSAEAPLTPADLQQALEQTAMEKERRLFEESQELDYGFSIPGQVRLRCNAAMQRQNISLSLRLIPLTVPTIEQMHLPEVCTSLAQKPRGLIIVSGMTGSGKSTTLAAILQYLNTTRRLRVVTIEDPVEYIFNSGTCNIIQRELGTDTSSFSAALKHVLRQDPDIIMVGEMRDRETASAVLSLAETGHLVLTTGHAPSTYQTLERVIDLFPVHERSFAQSRLASLLIAVLSQCLVPKADGQGRVPAVEIMMVTTAVSSLIREGKFHHLLNALRTSREEGMQTLDQSLMDLYQQGLINGKSLLAFCNDRMEIEKTIGEINTKLDGHAKENPMWAAARSR